MNLQEHLHQERIFYLEQSRKIEAIRELVGHTCAGVPALDLQQTLQAVLDRESVVSSWVAPGIAIPHARLPQLQEFVVAIGVSRVGIEYESGVGQPVFLLILILGDARRADLHIQLLAEVARTFHSGAILGAIRSAPSAQDIYRILENPRILSDRTEPEGTADLNGIILSHALELAGEVGAEAILLHTDALQSLEALSSLETETMFLLVTSREESDLSRLSLPHRTIHLPF